MVKKSLLAALAAGTILATAAIGFASPPMGRDMGPGPGGERPCMIDSANWTAAQKAEFQQDMLQQQEKMMELQKTFLNQEVAKGLVSRDWADQQIKCMQERLDWQKAHPGEAEPRPGMKPGAPQKAPLE
ncbi:hypothetical protein [Azotosporobacter soli]|uniref:hypothetical protein n=1 Tax=Azotosporobacter soli TaxID=3055040 RepID=UPI0031FE6C6A